MPRAERQATLDTVVQSSTDAPITFGRVAPLGIELRKIATDALHGLQYSFLAAAAHPQIRFPFGSLEEAFQGAIALRPTERRWVYHARARQIAGAPLGAREAAFGRYGTLSVEEFGRVGLASAADAWPPRGAGVPATIGAPLTTLALYITEVGCLDQAAPETSRGDEVHLGGLAIDAGGDIVKIGRFLVRDDFENGLRKDYGIPGRKLCEFLLPEMSGEHAGTYGVAAWLAVGDRAGFCQSLCEAWSKAGPVFKRAVEARAGKTGAVPISQVVGRVVEQFVQWLTEAFQDDVFLPGLAFASVPADGETAGTPGQFAFVDHRGRYRVGGQWRVTRG